MFCHRLEIIALNLKFGFRRFVLLCQREYFRSVMLLQEARIRALNRRLAALKQAQPFPKSYEQSDQVHNCNERKQPNDPKLSHGEREPASETQKSL